MSRTFFHRISKGSSIVSLFFLVAAPLFLISVCHAADYPNRPVDIVVPFAPGGGADNFFRAVRGGLAKELNAPTNIVNRAGGGGVVGASFVANARADGSQPDSHSYDSDVFNAVIC